MSDKIDEKALKQLIDMIEGYEKVTEDKTVYIGQIEGLFHQLEKILPKKTEENQKETDKTPKEPEALPAEAETASVKAAAAAEAHAGQTVTPISTASLEPEKRNREKIIEQIKISNDHINSESKVFENSVVDIAKTLTDLVDKNDDDLNYTEALMKDKSLNSYKIKINSLLESLVNNNNILIMLKNVMKKYIRIDKHIKAMSMETANSLNILTTFGNDDILTTEGTKTEEPAESEEAEKLKTEAPPSSTEEAKR